MEPSMEQNRVETLPTPEKDTPEPVQIDNETASGEQPLDEDTLEQVSGGKITFNPFSIT